MSAGVEKKEPSALVVTIAFVAVVALAALSFGLSYVNLGKWGLPVALIVAGAKAAIVVAIFMELSYQNASSKLAVATAVTLIAIMISLVAGDVATRDQLAVEPARATDVNVGPSRRVTEEPAKTSAGNGEGLMRP